METFAALNGAGRMPYVMSDWRIGFTISTPPVVMRGTPASSLDALLTTIDAADLHDAFLSVERNVECPT
jgi:hypothetical protein